MRESGLSVDDPLFAISERSIDMMSEKNYITGSDNVSE